MYYYIVLPKSLVFPVVDQIEELPRKQNSKRTYNFIKLSCITNNKHKPILYIYCACKRTQAMCSSK